MYEIERGTGGVDEGCMDISLGFSMSSLGCPQDLLLTTNFHHIDIHTYISPPKYNTAYDLFPLLSPDFFKIA